MSDLPIGTITFLFTDIEGSTRLWEDHPEIMRQALARHDFLMRAAIVQHNGHIFKTVGDAFYAAFSTATDALSAALAAQLALLSEPWPEPVAIRVRMALHSGAVEARDNDYFGQPLNRVARLLSAGHGGQILLSGVICDLVRDTLPASVTLLAMGEHRLRDLNRPETVFQLLHPDLPSDFPPLKSLDYLPNNLPLQLTSFIGREKEMAEITALLSKTRLLTLTGSGGAGKTRLSLQVAGEMLDQFPDGMWLVELASLSDPSLVPQAVASILNLSEQAGKSYTQVLIDYLPSKHLLLLLDNCEHLLNACAQLCDALLRACPQVKILASSREALGIAGEQTYRVPSLSLPDPKQTLTIENVNQYEAVRLFIERAASTQHDFGLTSQNASVVACLCHRLDGIPLAIELAAARVRALSVEEINTRLNNRFRLLTGGSRAALPRQQTLRALIDWSYDLLSPQEKLLLARLSVFAGGWTLEAAEQVCAGESIEDWEVLDLLTSLVDKSLVIAEMQAGATRYRLLVTVRHYALDRLLESGESEQVRARHRDYFLALAEEIRPKLRGREQVHWLGVLEEEHDNLRSSLDFCLEDPEGVEEGLRLATAMRLFWSIRGYISEGRQYLAAALSHPVQPEHLKERAAALNGAGSLAEAQGDYAAARALCEESLALRRELKDREGIANSLSNLGRIAKNQGDYAQARSLYEQSLAICRELGIQKEICVRLSLLGDVAMAQGDYTEAHALFEEALHLDQEIGDRHGEAHSLSNLGMIASYQGNLEAARRLHEQSLAIFRHVGDRSNTAHSLDCLAQIAYTKGEYTSARALYEESLAIYRELGSKKGIASCLSNLGLVRQDEGDMAVAAALYEESLALFREMGSKYGIACSVLNLGSVLQNQGGYAAARALYEESLALFRDLGDKRGIAYALDILASLACTQQQTVYSARLWGAAAALRATIGLPRTSIDQKKYEEEVAKVCSILDDTAFAAAFEEGRTMTLEQAVEYAIKAEA